MDFFAERLINWYHQEKRDLPWRKSKDPYHIWLSEVILQQTRVQQGLPYYLSFLTHFEKIEDLANAEEQVVLRLWQGLGYYSRARNLHQTAKIISKEFGGIFPNNYNDLLKLKGIGDYTASAIASFAFDEPKAVLDGNVFRVLSRFFDLDLPINSSAGVKKFKEIAATLLPKENSAIYNQAIMEFGALQCTPKSPNCVQCILNDKCLAYSNLSVENRPIKLKSKASKNRYFLFFFVQENDHLLIQKRGEGDIWQNLYQFPLLEVDEQNFQNPLISIENIISEVDFQIMEIKKHVLSHQNIFSKFVCIKASLIKIKQKFPQSKSIRNAHLDQYPFPKLILKFLEKI